MTKLKATLTTSSQTHISTVTAEYFYTKEHGYWNCAKTKKNLYKNDEILHSTHDEDLSLCGRYTQLHIIYYIKWNKYFNTAPLQAKLYIM